MQVLRTATATESQLKVLEPFAVTAGWVATPWAALAALLGI